ncbi:MAG: hypothetical protein LUQ65_04855 [Candidatus Helarchaeota archaeon]|nr:hypothetical protein [Candidatus Helarchaeota archaeon]
MKNDVNTLKHIFAIKNVKANIVTFSDDYPLLLIIDQSENDFVFGRFIRLRKTSPPILDLDTATEREIELKISENLAEMSHFVWNVKDKVMFAEYNFHAIRNFGGPLTNYLNHKFNTTKNKVTPMEDFDTYAKFKRDGKPIKTFRLGITQDKLKAFEKRCNISPLITLLKFSADKAGIYEIIVRKDRSKDVQFNKGQVIEAVEHLKSGDIISSLKVESQDAIYDLLNNNLLHFFVKLETEGKMISDRTQFYDMVKGLYVDNIDSVKENFSLAS